MIAHVALERLLDDGYLAGTVAGQRLASQVQSLLEDGQEYQFIVLDFAEIEIATSSCLRELVTGVRRFSNDRFRHAVVIAANVQDTVETELAFLLRLTGDAMLICERNGQRAKFKRIRLIGQLDTKLTRTLGALANYQEVDAATLAETYQTEERIGATGWNNRLAALVKMGLVRQHKIGKGKKYNLVEKELT